MGGRPENIRKATLDEHIANEDKQHLKANKRQQNEHGELNADDMVDKVDEASQESFPASDPPQQP